MPEYYKNKRNNPALTGLAKELRKNMTREEKHLWYDFLRDLPLTVNRKKVIGQYIVEFYIAEAKLAIVLDRSPNLEIINSEEDRERDAYKDGFDIRVLRYTNGYLNRYFSDLCADIQKQLEDRIPGFADRLK